MLTLQPLPPRLVETELACRPSVSSKASMTPALWAMFAMRDNVSFDFIFSEWRLSTEPSAIESTCQSIWVDVDRRNRCCAGRESVSNYLQQSTKHIFLKSKSPFLTQNQQPKGYRIRDFDFCWLETQKVNAKRNFGFALFPANNTLLYSPRSICTNKVSCTKTLVCSKGCCNWSSGLNLFRSQSHKSYWWTAGTRCSICWHHSANQQLWWTGLSSTSNHYQFEGCADCAVEQNTVMHRRKFAS